MSASTPKSWVSLSDQQILIEVPVELLGEAHHVEHRRETLLLTEFRKHPFLRERLVHRGGIAVNLFYLQLARRSSPTSMP